LKRSSSRSASTAIKEPRMSETSIQTRANPAPILPPASPPRRVERFRYAKQVLRALASLRLTVFLFVLSLILVFCGTLAMMDQGLPTVLAHYFRSGIAKIPLQLFVRLGQVFFGVPPGTQVAGWFPFPGGWLIGSALLVNLLAAHAIRFRFTWKRSGILILHSGIILLMIGELVTGLYAVEGNMTIPLGGSSNFVENFDHLELAFVWAADKDNDNVTVIPDNLLHTGNVIRNEQLPVDVEVVRYLSNSALPKEMPSGADNLATKGFGLETVAVEQPPGRGVDADQKRDMPSAYVTFKDKKTGEALGTYLVSSWHIPQDVEIDGTTYHVALRMRRTYRPFTFHLEELRHENYKGTALAKRYASLVRVTDPSRGEDREVLIHMNHPFYYQGETFYQISVNSTREGAEITGLQVVKNPGWALPYIACFMVSVGMAIHFLLHLLDFFRRKVTT
jgi:hypothetical protein